MLKKLIFVVLCAKLVVSKNVFDRDTTLDDVFKMDRVKDYIHGPIIGIASDNINRRLDRYLDLHEEALSIDADKYGDHHKTSDSKETNLWATYMPTDDPRSLMKNPDFELSVPAIIGRNGYHCETHVVVSQGYILNVHRIPRAKNGTNVSRNTVILQHGLFDSSFNWIINGPKRSLGYVLADAGYDVWMTNIRGNLHAREHAWYKTDSKEFWNFSFHEIAKNDLPAVIEYIKSVKCTETKIAFIGHSLGTTLLFSMLSLRPEYNQELSTGIALAPTVFLSHITSPIKSIKYFLTPVANTAKWINSYEVLPRKFYTAMSSSCQNDFGKMLCRELLLYMLGYDEDQVNKTIISQFWVKGNGASWKTLVHLSQLISSGEFKQFDYGKSEYNIRMYGLTTPPEYDLNKVKLNITLFWAKNDLLSNERDVNILHEKVPSTQMYLVDHPNFNHVDYLWANDAPRLVNNKVLELLKGAMPNNDDNNIST